MAHRVEIMPLTVIQSQICRLLAQNRNEESYLAGGAALHFAPNSKRYSNDLDYFHDSVERVNESFLADSKLLKANRYAVEIEMNQPGYIRALVSRDSDAKSKGNRTADNTTKIEWAHDTAWRFLPTQYSEEAGYQLSPVDLAVNKLLALAGRDEPRDFLDVNEINQSILPLGALIWAACGKDPGFTPHSLLELVKRRGKIRPEDLSRLQLAVSVDIAALKSNWLAALEMAEAFINAADASLVGCLFYDTRRCEFVAPDWTVADSSKHVVPHYGRPGGVLPVPARR